MSGDRTARQADVHHWVAETFGWECARSLKERAGRLLEEALELAQSAGLESSRAMALLRYVYGRQPGNLHQEAGGVGITLLAFCQAAGFDADREECCELDRVQAKSVEHFRARHQAKADAGIALPPEAAP